MAHAEIWDDSALINSWNEALDEYKHYHSIHARGEKISEVLDAFNSKESGSQETTGMDDLVRREEMAALNGITGDVKGEGTTEDVNRDQQVKPQSEDKLSQADQAFGPKPSEGGSHRISPPPLKHFVGSVPDDGLRSLLMSWYYAGYYTGLYEGRQERR